MANATVGTVTSLTENGSTADPAVDSLNTGTAAVTLLYDVKGVSTRAFFRVTNGGTHTATVTVAAGTYPPAMRSGIGAFTTGTIAASTGVLWLGPFDSGQFIQGGTNDGKLSVTFTPSGGDTITGTIQCFTVPLAG